ncbi:DUF5994 family protein [Dactylosporangium sp. NPDC049140]|uniref:DUF5994 family protein n=1 Tax=Dactylosporangium sp. NPDC049140 TaxID=3155647 RepID=UPI0033C4041E
MVTTAQRATAVPPGPPSTPRLVLAPARVRRAVLDGGWWPRSWDPIAEVPGLVVALAARYGPIRQLILNRGSWDAEFRRLAVDGRVVRAGWFTTADPAVLIATTDRGDQIDLLVVPPDTAVAVAESAMAAAADPANRLRAPALLAGPPAGPVARRPARAENADNGEWDNEGGHGARPDADSPAPLTPSRRR